VACDTTCDAQLAQDSAANMNVYPDRPNRVGFAMTDLVFRLKTAFVAAWAEVTRIKV
jgi:hypothetical protein